MKRTSPLTIILSICVFFFFINISFAQTKKVIIIGIDGCRPDALKSARTPNIDNLLKTAVYSLDALNDRITSSGPAWSSMLTGVLWDKHGVNNNSFTNPKFSAYPPLFKYLEDFDSKLHTVSISQWHPINDHIAKNYADKIINVQGASTEVGDDATNYLKFQNPDLIFVHFDDVDGAGHGYGYSTTVSQYIAAIEK